MNEYTNGVLEGLAWASGLSRELRSIQEARKKIDLAILLIVHASGQDIYDKLQLCKNRLEYEKRKSWGDF